MQHNVFHLLLQNTVDGRKKFLNLIKMRIFYSFSLYIISLSLIILLLDTFSSADQLIETVVPISQSVKEDVEVNESLLIIEKIVDGLKQLQKKFTGPPDTGQITFLLYNPKKTSGKWEKIGTGNSSKINTANLLADKPFIIAIHGFLVTCKDSDFPTVIFEAYIKSKAEYNFICVDWGPLAHPGTITQTASLLHYPKAVNNTLVVGETAAKFIEALITAGYLKTTEQTVPVHIVGHSLGSHIAGVCGHEFYNKRQKKIARISGLDPAGFLFYEKGAADKCKLGVSDAAFVDVIHTNMGQLGTNETLGHVNFIPNGGVTQPFCRSKRLLENFSEKVSGSCSHSSAVGMFAKSISKNITACKCKNWNAFSKTNGKCKSTDVANFGDKVSPKTRGKFCLYLKKL